MFNVFLLYCWGVQALPLCHKAKKLNMQLHELSLYTAPFCIPLWTSQPVYLAANGRMSTGHLFRPAVDWTNRVREIHFKHRVREIHFGFLANSKNTFGISKTCLGMPKNFLGHSQNEIGISKSFLLAISAEKQPVARSNQELYRLPGPVSYNGCGWPSWTDEPINRAHGWCAKQQCKHVADGLLNLFQATSDITPWTE